MTELVAEKAPFRNHYDIYRRRGSLPRQIFPDKGYKVGEVVREGEFYNCVICRMAFHYNASNMCGHVEAVLKAFWFGRIVNMPKKSMNYAILPEYPAQYAPEFTNTKQEAEEYAKRVVVNNPKAKMFIYKLESTVTAEVNIKIE